MTLFIIILLRIMGKVDNITDNEKELIQEYKDFSKQKNKKRIEIQHPNLFGMFLNYYALE